MALYFTSLMALSTLSVTIKYPGTPEGRGLSSQAEGRGTPEVIYRCF